MESRNYRIAAIGLAVAFAAGAEEIVIGGFPSVAPYALMLREAGKPEVVQGGIIKDIADEISRRTGLAFSFSFPPRKRMDQEILEGRLQIVGMANPAWLARPELMEWSPPVFEEKMVFLTPASSKLRVEGMGDLKGLIVGMNTGYVYSEFAKDPGFVRADSASVSRNILRMDEGWIQAVYGGELDIRYHIKGKTADYRVQVFSPASSSYQWALSKGLGEDGARILAALKDMLREGVIDAILAKYR